MGAIYSAPIIYYEFFNLRKYFYIGLRIVFNIIVHYCQFPLSVRFQGYRSDHELKELFL